MVEVIASVALCTSVLLLIVHYRNQVERRHGEIAQLRSDFLTGLAAIHHRLISIQLHTETARMELRRMAESDGKYNSIELMPQLIDHVKEVVRKVHALENKIEGIDTTKTNRTSVLLVLQSSEHELQVMEKATTEAEQMALHALELIRSKQEE